MGFLRKSVYLILFTSLLLSGCLASKIQIDAKPDAETYAMFGKVPSRQFYVPETIGDSIKVKWTTDINGGIANSSAVIYGDYLFINDLSGWVTCLDLNTGKRAGQLKDKGAVYSSPVVENFNLIYPVTLNNENYSLLKYYNFRTGVMTAEIHIEGKSDTQILKDSAGVIFTIEEGKIYKYGFNGKKDWEYDAGSEIHSSPALSNGTVVFGSDSGDVIGINAVSGEEIFKKRIGGRFFSGTAVSSDTGFIGDENGHVFAFDIKTGKIYWTFNAGSKITGFPVFNNEQLFIGTLGGVLFCLKKSDGELNWKSDLGGVINATPLLFKNKIIVPDLDGKLVFVNTGSGKVDKEYSMEGHVKLSPVFFKNLLFIGYDNGVMAAYEFIK